MGCESNGSKLICISSCNLGKSWSCCPSLCVPFVLLPKCHFTIEDVFRNATIIHTAHMTQPSHSALSKQSYILGRPARDRTPALITLSSQDMSRIRRMLLRWNVLNLLSCPAYVVHVSLPYSNVLITQAM